MIKIGLLEALDNSLFDYDFIQYLYGLEFILKDSFKLNPQKKLLLSQVRGGYEVDYQTPSMNTALQKIKK